MKELLKATIDAVRIVAKSRFFQIEEVDLRFANGQKRTFERLGADEQQAVMIVAVPGPGEYLKIQQYAAGIDQVVTTLPMGGLEHGESVLAAANRELIEETGFRAERLQYLLEIGIVPELMPHAIHLVLAQGLTPAASMGDEPVRPIVSTGQFTTLTEDVVKGVFKDARAISALYIAAQQLMGDTPDYA